jgi:hypothetical protein
MKIMSLANSYIELFKAFSHARVLRCLHGLAWVFLLSFFQFVPFSAWAGANQWTSIGPDGGSISALAIDPSHPATLYAGIYYSGVYKSTNGGRSWSPANTGLTATYVQALAIDPSNPATLYATIASKVYKSTDGGGSWSPVNTGLTNIYVMTLAIDPSHPATLYAGTEGGGVFQYNQHRRPRGNNRR